MSAVLASASADFTLGDVSVHLACSSPTELLQALAAFGKAPAANDAPAATLPPNPMQQVAAAPKPTDAAKPAATPSPTQAPVAEGNASASTGTPAGAPAAASGSAPAGDAPALNYDDVKKRVLALSKMTGGREIVLGLLGAYKGVNGEPCDHANKLQLPDYAAFVAAADAKLGVVA